MSAIEGQYVELVAAVDTMADALERIDTGDVFGALTCDEVEAIAGVLRAGGRDAAAEFIVAEHAESDDEGDAHYQGDDDEAES